MPDTAGGFQDDWQRLQLLVSGRSEFGRSSLAAVKAEELVWKIVKEHHVGVHVPPEKLRWLRSG